MFMSPQHSPAALREVSLNSRMLVPYAGASERKGEQRGRRPRQGPGSPQGGRQAPGTEGQLRASAEGWQEGLPQPRAEPQRLRGHQKPRLACTPGPREGNSKVPAFVSRATVTNDRKRGLKTVEMEEIQVWRPHVQNRGVAGLRSLWRLQRRMFLGQPSPGGSRGPLAGGCLAPVRAAAITRPSPPCASVGLLLKHSSGLGACSGPTWPHPN